MTSTERSRRSRDKSKTPLPIKVKIEISKLPDWKPHIVIEPYRLEDD